MGGDCETCKVINSSNIKMLWGQHGDKLNTVSGRCHCGHMRCASSSHFRETRLKCRAYEDQIQSKMTPPPLAVSRWQKAIIFAEGTIFARAMACTIRYTPMLRAAIIHGFAVKCVPNKLTESFEVGEKQQCRMLIFRVLIYYPHPLRIRGHPPPARMIPAN